ncbi:MAG: AAA family ATPase [Fimbriimonadaceae bacterium]|nr:AAA family ATPase [Fimbriimonadaceae bacterium]
MLGIRLFGYLEAVKGKEPPIRKFRSRSAGEVLAYLSVAMPRPVSREEVAATIWPEDEPDQARSSLRTALYSLRKQLGLPDDPNGPLGGDRQYVWLNPSTVETDLLSFQALVDRAQALDDRSIRSSELQRAIGLVRGPLLEGLEASWTLPHQLAFEEIYCKTVTHLIEVLASSGNAGLATEIGRAALRVVPLREDVHIALIRSLGADGRTSEALRQFEILEQLLLDHWGEYPSEQAIQAIEQLGQSGPSNHRRPRSSNREALGFQTSRGWVLGRDDEVNSILLEVQDVAGPRLWTLVGAGGCGKTTLAHAVAEKLAEVMTVRFVELSAAREVRSVVGLVARALELPEPNAPDAVDRVRRQLSQHPVLLILDNAEHLLPAISGVISSWVRADQPGRILLTSRAPLSIPGERQLALPPFRTPNSNETLSALVLNPAVGLFVLKAKDADPSFELSSQNATAIAEICGAMDGLPLAITLAASHVALMSPAQILKKLQGERFRVTAVGASSSERHSSLERATRWSYDLLTPTAQELFCRLAICRGDFSLELAEALHGGDVQECLLELTRSSLLERSSASDAVRFRMLIPLRTFGLERLRERGWESETRARLLDYCHALAGQLRWEFQGPQSAQAFESAERELDHFRQLADHALASGEGLAKAIKCGFYLGTFFAMRRHNIEWVERVTKLVEAATDSTGVSDHDMACGFTVLAQLNTYLTYQQEARRWLKKAIPVFEGQGNPIDLAAALNIWAMTHIMPSDTREIDVNEALATLSRSAGLLESAVGSGEWSAGHLRIATLSNLAAAYRMVDRNEEAIQVLQDALSQAQRANSKRLYPVLLLGIADNHMDLGHFDAALVVAKEAQRAAGQSGVAIYATAAQLTQAWCLLCLDRMDEAARLMCSPEFGAVRPGARAECSVALYIVGCALFHLGHEDLACEGYELSQRVGFRHGVTVRHKHQEQVPDFMHVPTHLAADLEPDDPPVQDFFVRAETTIRFGRGSI